MPYTVLIKRRINVSRTVSFISNDDDEKRLKPFAQEFAAVDVKHTCLRDFLQNMFEQFEVI